MTRDTQGALLLFWCSLCVVVGWREASAGVRVAWETRPAAMAASLCSWLCSQLLSPQTPFCRCPRALGPGEVDSCSRPSSPGPTVSTRCRFSDVYGKSPCPARGTRECGCSGQADVWGQMSLVAMEAELVRELSVTEGLVVPFGDDLVGSSPWKGRDLTCLGVPRRSRPPDKDLTASSLCWT